MSTGFSSSYLSSILTNSAWRRVFRHFDSMIRAGFNLEARDPLSPFYDVGSLAMRATRQRHLSRVFCSSFRVVIHDPDKTGYGHLVSLKTSTVVYNNLPLSQVASSVLWGFSHHCQTHSIPRPAPSQYTDRSIFCLSLHNCRSGYHTPKSIPCVYLPSLSGNITTGRPLCKFFRDALVKLSSQARRPPLIA